MPCINTAKIMNNPIYPKMGYIVDMRLENPAQDKGTTRIHTANVITFELIFTLLFALSTKQYPDVTADVNMASHKIKV